MDSGLRRLDSSLTKKTANNVRISTPELLCNRIMTHGFKVASRLQPEFFDPRHFFA